MPYRPSKKRKFFLIGIAIAFLGFVIFNMRDIIFGTHFTLSHITDGATVSSLVFPLSGSAPHAKAILVNGRPIGIDRSGTFSDDVLLSPGYNIIEVALEDRFGKEKIRTYHLYANPAPSVATALQPNVH